MKQKIRLLTPGPTMIPERVQRAMSLPILYHRSPEFVPVFKKVTEGLKKVFQTKNDVLILAASGSGAMEAVVGNVCQSGEKIIVVEAGKFGQRWTNLGKTFGCQIVTITVEWGQAVSIDKIEAAYRQHPDATALFVQASETSTGVYHPIERIAEWKKKSAPNLLLMVDGISAVGTANIPMDTWGIDGLVSGSQKAFMLPPGLAFVALSDRAWKKAEASKGKNPVFYFDLHRERKNQLDHTTAWTPAISLIMGLAEALTIILEEEGLEATFKRHQKLAHATRCAGRALGIELFAPESPSPAITAFKVPSGVDGSALVKTMRDRFGYTIAGGQDHLKGHVFRFGHMGYTDAFDMVGAFAALELTLKALKWDKMPALGTGTGAFLKALEDGL